MKFKQLSLQKMRLALKTVKALLYRFILLQEATISEIHLFPFRNSLLLNGPLFLLYI